MCCEFGADRDGLCGVEGNAPVGQRIGGELELITLRLGVSRHRETLQKWSRAVIVDARRIGLERAGFILAAGLQRGGRRWSGAVVPRREVAFAREVGLHAVDRANRGIATHVCFRLCFPTGIWGRGRGLAGGDGATRGAVHVSRVPQVALAGVVIEVLSGGRSRAV